MNDFAHSWPSVPSRSHRAFVGSVVSKLERYIGGIGGSTRFAPLAGAPTTDFGRAAR